MKKTRRIFTLKGNENDIQKVLNSLIGFKAITVLSNEITIENILEVFNNNKSVVCKDNDIFHHKKNNYVIEIFTTTLEAIMFNKKNVINVNKNIIHQFKKIADSYDIDIGDHISNISSKTSSEFECLFCRLINGKPVHEQAILYESENFLVIPGSGAFVDGYLLILPKLHIMSCSDLSYNLRQELFCVIEDVKFILNSIYKKNILIWENGSGIGGIGKSKTSIVHAHIHVCPSNLNIEEIKKAAKIPFFPIKREELQKYKKNSYLLVLDHNDNWHICYNKNFYIPRQYVRQLIAVEHNKKGEIWNWRKYPFWNNVKKNGDVFLNFIEKNFDNISPRIQKATEELIKKG